MNWVWVEVGVEGDFRPMKVIKSNGPSAPASEKKDVYLQSSGILIYERISQHYYRYNWLQIYFVLMVYFIKLAFTENCVLMKWIIPLNAWFKSFGAD